MAAALVSNATGWAPLVPGHIAELHGQTLHADVCRAVLAAGPDSPAPQHPQLNFNDPEAGTALHWAASQRLREACLALVACRHFTAVSAKLRDGSTALHVAASQGLGEVCEALLERHDFLPVSDCDRDGFTALHAAAFTGHIRCARVLLASPRFGSAVGAVGKFDVLRQPGHWAAKAADMYDMGTALHMAAAGGHDDICDAILSLAPHHLHAAADIPNRMGANALHMAARGGHTNAVRAILKHRHFTAVNARDARGFTALHWAAQQASGDMCHAILNRSDFDVIDARDLRGRTAADMAKDLGYHEVFRLILQRQGISGLADAQVPRAPPIASRGFSPTHASASATFGVGSFGTSATSLVGALGPGPSAAPSSRGLESLRSPRGPTLAMAGQSMARTSPPVTPISATGMRRPQVQQLTPPASPLPRLR